MSACTRCDLADPAQFRFPRAHGRVFTAPQQFPTSTPLFSPHGRMFPSTRHPMFHTPFPLHVQSGEKRIIRQAPPIRARPAHIEA